MSRSLSTSVYFALTAAALLALIVAFAGCTGLQETLTRAAEAGPGIADDAGAVVANPSSFTAWTEIAKALSYIILGRYGPETLRGTANLVRRKTT